MTPPPTSRPRPRTRKGPCGSCPRSARARDSWTRSTRPGVGARWNGSTAPTGLRRPTTRTGRTSDGRRFRRGAVPQGPQEGLVLRLLHHAARRWGARGHAGGAAPARPAMTRDKPAKNPQDPDPPTSPFQDTQDDIDAPTKRIAELDEQDNQGG